MVIPAAATAPPAQRLPGIDALKALACVLIIWHHLAFYGPMSDVVHHAAPGLMDWLYTYGRMAVQVFLVVGGFLAACSLAPEGVAVFQQPGHLILRRYRRLALPLMVAVFITVAVAALVRPWLADDSVPDAPTFWQLLSHIFLLQDVLAQEALSAGIWYVAIDFQLFVISVAVLSLLRDTRHRWLVLVLAAASLLYFNRDAGLDMTGLYFFGSYALGMLAWWASRSTHPARWLLAIAVLGGLALLLDFRGRLLVAVLVALGLVGLQRGLWAARWLQAPWLLQLGKISYSVFLIHFPVCLLVNAFISHFWPTQLLAHTLGLLAAFLLSLLAGAALYRGVESPHAPLHAWRKTRLIPQ
ncbi:acyltransferase [Polaromonas sp. SM01]|uniref:acyltransferase family protein n=1 Tax=Polaromonas sp. SM01 TaxID=3085630 RepID=UPI002980ACB8|nr:acyltransferase [Polaromonas sp. SM01]MDW5442083.1 acyltransferase [Polaromonas sp. SM01]